MLKIHCTTVKKVLVLEHVYDQLYVSIPDIFYTMCSCTLKPRGFVSISLVDD